MASRHLASNQHMTYHFSFEALVYFRRSPLGSLFLFGFSVLFSSGRIFGVALDIPTRRIAKHGTACVAYFALALVALLLVFSANARAAVYEVNFSRAISAAYDTAIDNYSGVSHGSDVNFTLTNGSTMSTAWYWFDIMGIPPSATIINASLVVHSFTAPGSAWVIAYGANSSWNESANWATSNGVTAWATPGGDYNYTPVWANSISSGENDYAYNVTSLVGLWAASQPNYGFVFSTNRTTNNKSFASLESPTGKPRLYVMFDSANIPPVSSSASSNVSVTIGQRPVAHSVRWLDLTGNLSGFIFSSNYSGLWQNDSFVPFGGMMNYSNYTKVANESFGVYGWMFYANDTFNAFNSSALSFITVSNNTAPNATQVSVLPSSPMKNESLNCSFVVSDAEVQSEFANVTWYRDGIYMPAYDSLGVACTNHQLCYASVAVPPSDTFFMQNWTCQVTAYDDLGASGQANASALINYFVTLQPAGNEAYDTYLDNTTEIVNSTASRLSIGFTSGGNESALVHFDTSLLGAATISSSAFTITANMTGKNALNLRNVTASWNASATWGTSDGVTPWTPVSRGDFGPVLGTYYNDFAVQPFTNYSFNATPLVSSWISGPNYGLLLSEANLTKNKTYYSLDAPELAFKPSLSVKFTAANIPPSASFLSTNLSAPVVGSPLMHSVRWVDYTGGLSYYIFSSNYSGSWSNSTPVAFAGGNMEYSNYTTVTSSSPGTYAWKIYANDSFGAFNSSPLAFQTLLTNTPPTLSTVSLLPFPFVNTTPLNCSWVATEYDLGQQIHANVTWYKNGDLSPSYNTTMKLCANSTICYADVAVAASSLASGDRWECRVSITDGFVASPVMASAFEAVAYRRSYLLSTAAGRDTFISNWSSADVGAYPNISLRSNSPFSQRALFYYDFSFLSGVRILDANLTLTTLANPGSGSTNITAYNMTAAWNESATWAAYDGVNSWASPGGDFSPTIIGSTNITTTSADIQYSWGVTPLVQAWVLGYNNGVALAGSASVNISKNLHSRETLAPSKVPMFSLLFEDAKPVVSSVSVNPAIALGGSSLNCSVIAIDYDTPSLHANFTWYTTYLNTTVIPVPYFNSNTATCQNATVCYSPLTVDPSNTTAGQAWVCQATVYDNSGGASAKNGSAKIGYFQAIIPGFGFGKDNTLSQAFPSVSFGQSNLLGVGTTGASANRSVIYFDLSAVPVNSTVMNATLFLYAPNPPSGSPLINAYLLSRPFNGSATWNSFDGSNAWLAPGGDFNATPVGSATVSGFGWSAFNATVAAQSWVDNQSRNNGLLLKLQDESSAASVFFYSSNESVATGMVPYLAVTYVETPNNPPNITYVSVIPASPQVSDSLNCSWIVTNDESGQSLIANVTWFNGSTRVALNDSIDVQCQNNTLCYATSNLSSFLMHKGESWLCNVVVVDQLGKADSKNSSAVSVGNTPPSIPTSLSPASGTFDNYLPVNCSGSFDPNTQDTLTYFIDAYYGGAWNPLASTQSGQYNWSLALVNSQSGVDLRCNVSDGMSFSDYLYASNFTSGIPGINISHSIDFSPQAQAGPAAVSQPVLFQVNVSGISEASCNYSGLPADRIGILFVRNESDGSNMTGAAVSNGTTWVWWNCSLQNDNYSVFFEEPAPVLSYSWLQNSSKVSNFSTQYIYASASVSNPSATLGVSQIMWNITCPDGMACSSTGGFQNLSAASSAAFNISASGDNISEYWYPISQNTSDPANATADRQKIYRGLLLDNELPIAVTVFSGISYPPAFCWNSTQTNDAPSANVTVPLGTTVLNNTIFWVDDCIANTSGSPSSSATVSNQTTQVILRQVNLTNVGKINLTVFWSTTPDNASCWSSNFVNGSALVPVFSNGTAIPVTLYANQTGSCLTVGPWSDYFQVSASLASQRIRKSRNVTNSANVNLTAIYWNEPDGLDPCWIIPDPMSPYSVNANSTLLFNMTHQGACITNTSVIYSAVPADDGTFNESLVVVKAQMNVTSLDNHTAFSFNALLTRFPGACLSNSPVTAVYVSPLSSATVESAQSGDCISNTSSAWATNASFANTIDNQSISRTVNVTSALNLSLSPVHIVSASPTNWSCLHCEENVSLAQYGRASINVSAWGDVLNEFYGNFSINNSAGLSSFNGSAITLFAARQMNVTNNGGYPLNGVLFNSSYLRPLGNWTCADTTLNISISSSANKFNETCSSNDTLAISISDSYYNQTSGVSVDGGYVWLLSNVSLSNADYFQNFTVNISVPVDANWSSSNPSQAFNAVANQTYNLSYPEYRDVSSVFGRSFFFNSSSGILNSTMLVSDTAVMDISNVTAQFDFNDSASNSTLGFFVLNGSSYDNVTPGTFDSGCNGSTPAYEFFFVNGAYLGVCSQDRNANGLPDYYKALIPHFSSWNFTIMSSDLAAPAISNATPFETTNLTGVFSLFSNEPADCKAILDVDANYSDMPLAFTSDAFASLSSQQHQYNYSSLAYGAHTIFAKCQDHAGNLDSQSANWTFTVAEFCGNSICEAGENCTICPSDCSCATPTPQAGGGGSSGGTSSGGSAGSGSSGSDTGATPIAKATPSPTPIMTPSPTPEISNGTLTTPLPTATPVPAVQKTLYDAEKALNEAKAWRGQMAAKGIPTADVDALLGHAQDKISESDYPASVQFSEDAKNIAQSQLRKYYLDMYENDQGMRKLALILVILLSSFIVLSAYRNSLTDYRIRLFLRRMRGRPRTLKELAIEETVASGDQGGKGDSAQVVKMRQEHAQSTGAVASAYSRLKYRHQKALRRVPFVMAFLDSLFGLDSQQNAGDSGKQGSGQSLQDEQEKEPSTMRDFHDMVRKGKV